MKIACITGIIAFAVISCIHPIYPHEQVLQHLGTLLLLVLLITGKISKRINNISFYALSIFTIIHIVGARYIYSYVPYQLWIKSITGFDINIYFNISRNHYDRFVHLAFGLLFFPYIYQLVSKNKLLGKLSKILISLAFIQTFSMFYELFEWVLTLFMSSEMADNYNGQQGDMWDAQKDMAIAMLGSTIMATIYLFKDEKLKININSNSNEKYIYRKEQKTH